MSDEPQNETETERKDRLANGQFAPGVSGNPSGRAGGLRKQITDAVDKLFGDEAQDVAKKAVEMAKAGDMTAIRLVIDRILPAPKDRPIKFDMPEIVAASDAVKAVGSIIKAVSDGDMTPGEGQAVAAMVETMRRTLETEDLERRVKEIEDRQAKR